MATTNPSPVADNRLLDNGELLLLGAIWGASFLFMRISAPEFGALPVAFLRVLFGAALLLPFLLKARAQFPATLWPKLFGIGAVNTAIPFALFAWAAERAPAGVSSIANAMTVLFTALAGVLFFGQSTTLKRMLALLPGFAGVIVLASGKTDGAHFGWPVAAGVTAAALYGLGINWVKRHLSHLPSGAVACATLVCSAIMLAPFALWQWPQHAVSQTAWLATIGLGLLCSGIAFVLYYRLIARIGASRASTVTYLIPLFAVTWAWIFLREPLTWSMAVACGMILLSVFISQRQA